MDKKYNCLATTVRFDERSSVLIGQLVKQTRASQSEVIRHLVKKALNDPSSISVQTVVKTDLDSDSKSMLFDISNQLASILTSLNKIGANVNVRRKNYNSERRHLTQQVKSLDARKRHMSMYEKALADEKLKTLQDKVEKFDNCDREFITQTEWEQFITLKESFEQIAKDIGGKLKW